MITDDQMHEPDICREMWEFLDYGCDHVEIEAEVDTHLVTVFKDGLTYESRSPTIYDAVKELMERVPD